MYKKINIHKNRILPTLLIMTFIMVMITLICAMLLTNTIIVSMTRDCSVFDSSLEKFAVLEQKDIEHKKKLLYVYSKLLKNADEMDKEQIMNIFYELENNIGSDGFTGLALILHDDSLVSYHQNLLGENELEEMKNVFNQNENEYPIDLYIGAGQDNTSYYSIPILFDSGEKGILAGMLPADIAMTIYKGSLKMYNSTLYLMDPNQRVMFYYGKEGRNFSYSSLNKNLFYDRSKSYDSHTDLLFNSLSGGVNEPIIKVAGVESYDMANILKNFKDVEIIFQDDNYIWYEKPVRVGNETWKLVAGKLTCVSGESLSLIFSGAVLVAFVILVSFFIIIILVLSQGISNKKLMRLAYTDLVTGSHNWLRFQLEAQKLLGKRYRSNNHMIISMDIRKFRVISNIDGEMKSDVILKRVADILQKQLGPRERFARFAVDEFAILLKCHSESEVLARIESIDSALKSQVLIPRISFCYGIYPVKDDSIPIIKMYNYAGIARDLAKTSGENSIIIFDDSMWNTQIREKELESCMEEALAKEEFKVYLQPKYSADGSHVGGAEALVRWVSPKFGFISPADFIPLFEKNGFILKLDTYMLNHVCAIQKKWMDLGHELVAISVNISRVHFIDPVLVDMIISTIGRYGIPHSCIELEITESAFFDDKKVLLDTVIKLREFGFCISMDDFGTGYSSLNSLKDLPLDVIKLDGEFFQFSDDKERSETVIKDTIHLAKNLHMKIVAEGIETKEQVDFLHEMGCDLIQGFYFAKPMPVSDFEALMKY